MLEGTLGEGGQLHVTCVQVCLPAEDRSFIFGVHGEPNCLLSSASGDGFCGDRLAGGGLRLSLFLTAV